MDTGLAVLGGDTNASSRLALMATAVGTLSGGALLTRRGARPGDLFYSSGPLGLGGAFALRRLLPDRSRGPDVPYRPRARLREGQALRGIASCCIDTSDGFLAALDELCRRNGLGLRIHRPIEALLHPVALQVALASALPPWTLLAGPHGEFELLFTVPALRTRRLESAARALGWSPIPLGEVVQSCGIELDLGGGPISLDGAHLRNLFGDSGNDPARYLEMLVSLDRELALSSTTPVDRGATERN